jgi:hypothetical protein
VTRQSRWPNRLRGDPVLVAPDGAESPPVSGRDVI